MAAKKKRSAKKTASGKGKRQMSKAAFVRSQPADMPAKDVIAKAKEVGIKLTEDTVYKTRSNAKKSAAKKRVRGANKAATTGVGENTRKGVRGRAPDKRNRVLELRAQNPDWTAEQIAKAAECSTTYVYSVWGGSKRRGGSNNGVAKPKSPVAQHLDHVRALRGVILHVGIDRAKEMMDQVVRDLMVLG